jgi:hypothetical protein
MASQVLSGPSNPSYTNNTGQNVRIVINYMAGTAFTPGRTAPRDRFGNALGQDVAPIPSTITISWAGVSVGSASNQGSTAIGRNLAYSQLFRDTQAGGVQTVRGQDLVAGQPGFVQFDAGPSANITFDTVAVTNSISLAAIANNAAGFVGSLPTELILAPGETFSAVCGVHNIVVIPEAG